MKSGSRVNSVLKRMEVEDPKEFLGAHSRAWELINLLLKEEEDRVSKELYSREDYSSPNWDMLKADQGGQMHILNKLKSIFKD